MRVGWLSSDHNSQRGKLSSWSWIRCSLFKLKIQESIDLPRLRRCTLSYRHGQPRVRPRIWKWECPTRKAGRLDGTMVALSIYPR